ncbi:MAG: ATP synthase F1 subunit gamma [Myxococcales bacterium]|nr:ATP synthase F1 subunit gamma [Myxococcales bacterium]MCB9522726.1 ATP synthase F1 subunit gamma [Myxococcales bacterium]
MPSLKDIRKRIASVKNTQKITRAMKLVSAAKLRRAQDAMNELRPYAAKHRELLGSLVSQLSGDGEAPHPLLQQRETVKTVAVLALSSDRGMCGGFNSGIQKQVAAYVAQRKAEGVEDVQVFTLGRRVGLFAAKNEAKVGYAYAHGFGEIIAATREEDIMRGMTERLVDGFLDGAFDEVVVLFNVFKNAITQVPTVRPLLPVAAEGDAGAGDDEAAADLIYEPNQASLLGYIVPRYVEVQVRQSVLESVAGEHAARMNAMNAATDNASEMIRTLTLQANRARQAAITTELTEIISGVESMN